MSEDKVQVKVKVHVVKLSPPSLYLAPALNIHLHSVFLNGRGCYCQSGQMSSRISFCPFSESRALPPLPLTTPRVKFE